MLGETRTPGFRTLAQPTLAASPHFNHRFVSFRDSVARRVDLSAETSRPPEGGQEVAGDLWMDREGDHSQWRTGFTKAMLGHSPEPKDVLPILRTHIS